MKLSLSLLFLTMTSVAAFTAPPSATTFTRGLTTTQQQRTTILFSEPSDDNEEEEGLDLNLEEMFEMFDAADKEEDFDDAVKKVKGSN